MVIYRFRMWFHHFRVSCYAVLFLLHFEFETLCYWLSLQMRGENPDLNKFQIRNFERKICCCSNMINRAGCTIARFVHYTVSHSTVSHHSHAMLEILVSPLY